MKLDHIVFFTHKTPSQIVAEQKRIGHHAIIGGNHLKWGTWNALLFTKNAYIEWLSVREPQTATKSNHPLTSLLLHDLNFGDGWGTFCVSVDDISRFEKLVLKNGFKTSGIINGNRKTPDGQWRKWKMLFIDKENPDTLPYPFFIEWEESETDRLTKLRNDGSILPENEIIEIKECLFHVRDIHEYLNSWSKLLDQKISKPDQIKLPNVVLRFIPNNSIIRERLTDVLIK